MNYFVIKELCSQLVPQIPWRWQESATVDVLKALLAFTSALRQFHESLHLQLLFLLGFIGLVLPYPANSKISTFGAKISMPLVVLPPLMSVQLDMA